MSEKEEQRPQDEEADVQGHKNFLNEEESTEDDQAPDVEGHFHSKAPVREHSKKNF